MNFVKDYKNIIMWKIIRHGISEGDIYLNISLNGILIEKTFYFINVDEIIECVKHKHVALANLHNNNFHIRTIAKYRIQCDDSFEFSS